MPVTKGWRCSSSQMCEALLRRLVEKLTSVLECDQPNRTGISRRVLDSSTFDGCIGSLDLLKLKCGDNSGRIYGLEGITLDELHNNRKYLLPCLLPHAV